MVVFSHCHQNLYTLHQGTVPPIYKNNVLDFFLLYIWYKVPDT